MQYTQEQVDWYNQVTSSGQMTAEQAVAALQAAMQPAPAPAAAPAPVAQAVQQAAAPIQGVASGQAASGLDLLSSIAMTAAEDEDHAAILSGKPPRAGLAYLRIKNYIEIGVHQGKNTTYSPKPIAIVTVELNHPDHLVDEDGVKVPRELDIRISKTHSNNSKFPKFFKALSKALGNHPMTGKPITHLSQALGMGCLGEVVHNKSDDKVYANLDDDGAWSFKPSAYLDPASNQMVEVPIPPLHGKPMLFMIENQQVNANPEAVKAMWDSIHIPGVRKYKDAQGVEKESSNNYYQELIAKSLEWTTAPIKRILDSLGCTTTFGGTPAQAVAPTQAVAPVQAQAPVQAVAPVAPVQAPAADLPFDLPAQAQVAAPVAQAVPQAQPQVVPQAVPQAQPSVVPAAGGMSAADFMQQFNQ